MARRANLKPKVVEKHRNPNATQDRKTVREEARGYVSKFINDLTPPIITELLEGYENDFQALLTSIQEETERVIYNIPDYRFSKNATFSLDNVFNGFDEALKRHNYNYFKTTMLTNFDMGWRNIEWGNILTKYPWHVNKAGRGTGKSWEYCYAFPLFRIWRYRKPTELNPDTIDNKNSKEVCIITNESKLGKIHLEKIAQQIEDNEKFHEVLMWTWGKKKSEALGKEEIKGFNGTKIILRSRQSKSIRGLHVGTVLVDDFLDKSAIYSAEQRESFKETFYGEIVGIVNPGGMLAVSGTPFSHIDLYNDLSNDPKFKVFMYPAIYPNGRLLAPDIYTYEELLSRRESMGSIMFSREMLVIPISDSSTFFPFEWLMSSIRDMENVSYVENKESYPIKMKKIIAGCDFAKSANIGADFTVYTVWGLGLDDRYYLMYMWRKRGASINEQVSRLLSIDERFKPNKIVCEVNGFQGTIVELAKQRGLKNIVEFTTTSQVKRDLLEGLLSLSPMFERGEIRTPYKEGSSKEQTDILHGEFNSITFDEDKGKVGSVLGHDDICMSSFFAITYLRENKGSFKIHLV